MEQLWNIYLRKLDREIFEDGPSVKIGSLENFRPYSSHQICEKRATVKTYNIIVLTKHFQIFLSMPTLIGQTYYFGDHAPFPTNMPTKYQDTCMQTKMLMLVPHPHLCNQAVFLDISTKSGNPGHNQVIGPNSSIVLAIESRAKKLCTCAWGGQ